ncbi:MAG: hypothetical protein RIE73_30515 [Coleofasciculus sp. C1-SOL-03]|uniref:hypothetical protein n=2 Tax=unclassified Coleofasciculus TaxID=2692782 RepID=UPI0032FA5D47
MEITYPWGDTDSSDWLKVLSLPILEWAQPFIPLLDLPPTFLEAQKQWQFLHTQGVKEYETRLWAGDWPVGVEGGPGELVRQVVIKFLGQLAEQKGEPVAIALARWALFHFFCPEARTALSWWGRVLRDAYLREDSRRGRRKVPPPEVLVPLLSELYPLIDLDRRQDIYAQIKAVAPPAPPEQQEQIPDTKMEHCFEAYSLRIAVNQALSCQALQLIARKLNPKARQEVVDWAQLQLKTMSPRHGGAAQAQQLCGTKYLRPDPPWQWQDIPSIFDIPATPKFLES